MQVPYGVHDYKTLITKKYLYIDKTMYIEKMETLGENLVFLRPRRFGKSLFTSMLHYYYDINHKENYNHLFSSTYIGKNKTPEANFYYILKMDFSGINSEKDRIEEEFNQCVYSYLQSFINDYKLNMEIDRTKNINIVLRDFFIQFRSIVDGQIYLLIDEYDHFANNVLTSDLNLFNEITGKDGFVRSFYEVLKTYAGIIIGRMFITGVTPITLDSLTSGFNNTINLSKENLLNEMMGFTEEEVLAVLDKWNIPRNHLETLRENYNGYLFNEESEIRVYNSNMVLYYLRNFTLYNKAPSNLTDPNIISDYTKITRMFDLYKDFEDKKEIIHNILNSDPIYTTIIDKFNLRLEFTKEQFLSLLYYLGLLTIDKAYGGLFYLKTPNYIIKTVYFEYYFHYLNKIAHAGMDASKVNDAVYHLSFHNDPLLLKGLLEDMLKKISGRDFIKFDEKYIKLLMVTYFNLSKMYRVKSEYEVEAGYIDIALLPNHAYELNNYFIFEIKYISSGDFNEKILNNKRKEAIEQIKRYADCKEMKEIPNLRKYIFVFVYNECRVMEEI